MLTGELLADLTRADPYRSLVNDHPLVSPQGPEDLLCSAVVIADQDQQLTPADPEAKVADKPAPADVQAEMVQYEIWHALSPPWPD